MFSSSLCVLSRRGLSPRTIANAANRVKVGVEYFEAKPWKQSKGGPFSISSSPHRPFHDGRQYLVRRDKLVDGKFSVNFSSKKRTLALRDAVPFELTSSSKTCSSQATSASPVVLLDSAHADPYEGRPQALLH